MSEETTTEDSVEEVAVEEESQSTHDIIGRELDKLEESTSTSEPEETVKEEVKAPPPERSPWKSWKAEAAAELEKLPETVQKHIIEREEQFHRGIEQYKSAANFAKSIDKSIAPYKNYLEEMQVAPDVAFFNLLKTEHTLRRGSYQEKAEMLMKLAHDYQIDMNQLAGLPYDPTMHNLKAQLDEKERQLREASEFKQSHEDAQIQSKISDFAQRHEYFTEVQSTMADLLERGLANDLDDAYEKALRLNDNTFQKVYAQQQGGGNRQNLTQADQAAKAAKAAAVSVKGSPAGANRTVIPATTEEAVRQAMRLHGF
jgi:hypothetical protein